MTNVATKRTLPKAVRPPSNRTRAAYRKRAHQLLERCVREAGGSEGKANIGWTRFVAWLIERKSGWVPPTWRYNRSAVADGLTAEITVEVHRLAHKPLDDAEEAGARRRLDRMRKALATLRAESSADCARDTNKTSSRKFKRLPEADRLKIANKLARMQSCHAKDLDNFLLAGVRCGLRLIEWRTVAVMPSSDPAVLVLVVRNAKADEVRGHGPTRRLTFDNLGEDRRAILAWIARIQDAGDGADALITALRDLLHRVTRGLWPRRTRQITLYSARHAFAALAKLRYAPDEVAALMGHATDETASKHYGRYRAGRLTPEIRQRLDCLPQPAPEEVLRVRRILGDKLERLTDLRKGASATIAAP